MNGLIVQYLHGDGNFEDALILSEHRDKSWSDAVSLAPDLLKGWFELSRLSQEDRIEFTRDFWLKSLPYRPSLHQAIYDFFDAIDDVGAVLTLDRGWHSELIYSLQDNSCFFRGGPPAINGDLAKLEREINFACPPDWKAFMKIHNGFGKLRELRLLPVQEIADAKRRLTEMMMKNTPMGKPLDPAALVPFYEAFGLSSFQCFFSDWYPEGEMGNVYFSGIDYTISDTSRREAWGERGAFPSFSDWLISFLEGMESVP